MADYEAMARDIIRELHKLATRQLRGLDPADRMKHQKDVRLPAAKIALQFIQGADLRDPPPGYEPIDQVRERLEAKKKELKERMAQPPEDK